jgi:hypothetical protein
MRQEEFNHVKAEFVKRWSKQPAKGYGSALFDFSNQLLVELHTLMWAALSDKEWIQQMLYRWAPVVKGDEEFNDVNETIRNDVMALLDEYRDHILSVVMYPQEITEECNCPEGTEVDVLSAEAGLAICKTCGKLFRM